jgi:activator of HSP90 ATPase
MTQKVHFKASPATLFSLYTDSRLHSESTGSGAFTAGDGYIGGVNLHVEKDRMIVQTWRGSDWRREDPDSIFILLLIPDAEGTTLHVTHANIPDEQFEGIREGWKEYYWKPWKAWIRKAAAEGK